MSERQLLFALLNCMIFLQVNFVKDTTKQFYFLFRNLAKLLIPNFLGLVEDQGFLDQLKELLSDSNPMVVANAVAALSEINESSPTGQPLVGELVTSLIYSLFVRAQILTNSNSRQSLIALFICQVRIFSR